MPACMDCKRQDGNTGTMYSAVGVVLDLWGGGRGGIGHEEGYRMHTEDCVAHGGFQGCFSVLRFFKYYVH